MPEPLLCLRLTYTSDDEARTENTAYVGVHEFTAPDGNVIVPPALLETVLGAPGGALVRLETVDVSAAHSICLRPVSRCFCEIADQRAVLEAGVGQ